MLEDLVRQYGIDNLLTQRVLIVDDETPNLDVLSAVLENDYEVLSASSGPEALRLLAQQGVDVVITDQRMPDMTGLELLQEVRLRRPDVAGMVLTGYTDLPVVVSAINVARVFRFMTKPFERHEMLAAVAHASQDVYQRRAISQLVNLLARRNDELNKTLTELTSTQQHMLHMERLGTMGRLASGVTHDLRNFLQGLAMLDEEVSASDGDGRIKRTVSVCLSGVRNLLQTLDTMNQFARTGELGLCCQAVAPKDILGDSLVVMHMDMEFRRRKFEEAIAPELPFIQADRRKLTQVMVNLLRNAVQATQGGDRIRAEVTRSQGEVLFSVEDAGPGIAPDVANHMFDAFSSTKGENGMGMGLYMARLVAESHGGRIECQKGSLGGARFMLVLPYERVESQGAATWQQTH